MRLQLPRGLSEVRLRSKTLTSGHHDHAHADIDGRYLREGSGDLRCLLLGVRRRVGFQKTGRLAAGVKVGLAMRTPIVSILPWRGSEDRAAGSKK